MLRVEIRFKGHLDARWSDWFGGLTISHPDPEETVLSGHVADSSALYGIISRLRDLGLELTSVSSQKVKENSHE